MTAAAGAGAEQSATYAAGYAAAGAKTVRVRATDAVGNVATRAVTVDVNPAPTAIALAAMIVAEGAAAGSLVGAVRVVDAGGETGQALELLDDAGGRFALDDGRIVAGATPVDHEAATSRAIRIAATDRGGERIERTLSIAVGDENEAPAAPRISNRRVSEAAEAGAVLDILSATDPDAGDVVAFGLLDDAGGRFAVQGRSLVATGVGLDYETAQSHQVTVAATDSGGLATRRVIDVIVTDADERRPDAMRWRTLDDAPERIELDASENRVVTTLGAAHGDVVSGLGSEDSIVFSGESFGRNRIKTTQGERMTLSIDGDGDGVADADAEMEFEGDFDDGEFMLIQDDEDVVLSFEAYPTSLDEEQAVDPDAVNGVNNPLFLKGDGTKAFAVTLNANAVAGYDNALGVYDVTGDGHIVDVRMLFDSRRADAGASAQIAGVEDGHELGFFIVQDAAAWAAGLADGAVLAFLDQAGAAGRVGDGEALGLSVDGRDADQTALHSYDPALNPGGVQHALSGVEPGGESITIGFQDLIGGGDRDFQDLPFSVALL